MGNPIGRIPNRGIIDRIVGVFSTPKASPKETLGAAGFSVQGGYLVTNERNPKLQGQERYRTFSDILANVSIVAAGTRYFANLVAKAGWQIEPAESELFTAAQREQAVILAEKVEDMLYDLEQPWPRVVRRASLFKFYGFSIAEWTAKRRQDGLIGMLDIAARPQSTIERWVVDVTGAVQVVVQRSPQTQEEIELPRGKLVYAVDDSLSDTPDGMGLLRHLVEPAERLARYQVLEGVAFDTELRGIPVIYGPLQEIRNDTTMTPQEKAAALGFGEKFIQKHQRNAEMGIFFDSAVYRGQDDAASPSSARKWSLELVQGTGSGTAEVAVAIERLNREMARIIGVEGLLLGGEKVGSMALSQDKSQNFALNVDSTLTELSEVFRRDIVMPIFMLNGWDIALMPTLKTDHTQYRDVEQITRSLVDLASAGAVLAPDDPAIDAVRDLLGLPRPPEIDLVDAAGTRSDESDEQDEPADDPEQPTDDEIEEEVDSTDELEP